MPYFLILLQLKKKSYENNEPSFACAIIFIETREESYGILQDLV